MELRDYIEQGIKAKNGIKPLAAFLGMVDTSLHAAKAHKRSIPNVAAVKLASLIGADPLAVIAASELATERQEEKREFWFPFVNHSNLAKTAGIALIFSIVTNFVTPSPAEAAPVLGSPVPNNLYYVKCRKIFMRSGFFAWLCRFLANIRQSQPGPCRIAQISP